MSDSFDLSQSDWQAGSQAGATSAITEGQTTGLSRHQFELWHQEIKNQPAWRAEADREADYCDGNQLDSDILRKQQAIGMPPAIEPLIGPALDSVLGMEAQRRTDWRVLANDDGGDDVAEALNEKLNIAERQSKSDRACSEAFAGQAKIGVGWVEVQRDNNPFNYPYRCVAIPRNEIFWDWRGSNTPDETDHRYRIRRKWTDKDQAKLLFPDKVDLIDLASRGWTGFDTSMTWDGGKSTGLSTHGDGPMPAYGAVATPLPGESATSYPMLAAHYSSERGSSLEEQEWRDTANNRVCLFEVWYRVWSRSLVMKMPDGRVVEYDPANDMHTMMVASGAITPTYAVISKVRLSWWLGPHCLSDSPSPYRHNKFPYVPFWGKKEDRTGVPFGLIRGMMYMQDCVNSLNSKIRWGISAVRTERTEGAVLDDDETLRREVSSMSADIVLNKDFKKDGHVFSVTRDFQLNEQQFRTLQDAREGINRCGGIYKAFEGQNSNATSGVMVSNLAQQSTQTLADLYDNFHASYSEVGELLLSMIVEDMIGKPTAVVIKGNAIKDDKQINLNVQTQDPETGMTFLDNDIERTLLKVTLEDVPNTPSFKAQQLNSFSEVFKSAPQQFQNALFPQLLSLMDTPNKQDAIKAVKQAMQNSSPEQIQEQIKQAVDSALTKANVESKMRELDLKEKLNEAQIKNLLATGVKTTTEAEYMAMQAAEVIASIPQVAPIADVVLKNAGYQQPNPAGVDQSYATAPGAVPITVNNIKNPHTGMEFSPNGGVPKNTHPQFPPNPAPPASPGIGAGQGIETQRADGVTP